MYPSPSTGWCGDPVKNNNLGASKMDEERENEKKKKKEEEEEETVLGEAEKLLHQTTAHGVGTMWRNRRKKVGVVWAVVILSMVIGLTITTINYTVNFYERRIYSTSNIVMGFQRLQLPSFVICNRALFSLTKLEALGVDVELSNYLMLLVGTPYLAYNSFRQDTAANLRLEKNLQLFLKARKLTLSELIIAVSLTCEELVIYCSLGRDEVLLGAECCRAMVEVRTLSGRCYQWLAGDDIKQFGRGEWAGLTLVLNSSHPEPELAEGVVDPVLWLKRAVQVTLVNNVIHPSALVTSGNLVPPRTLTIISVSLIEMNSVKIFAGPERNEPPCVKTEELRDRHSDAYFHTDSNCAMAVARHCSIQICGCSCYWDDNHNDSVRTCSTYETYMCNGMMLVFMGDVLSGNTNRTTESSELKTLQMKKCIEGVVAECRVECKMHVFSEVSNTQPLLPQHLRQLQRRFALPRSEGLSVVNVFHPKDAYTEVVLWRQGYEDFISQLGGTSGLLLGCSVITVFEFLMFFICCCRISLRKLKPLRHILRWE